MFIAFHIYTKCEVHLTHTVQLIFFEKGVKKLTTSGKFKNISNRRQSLMTFINNMYIVGYFFEIICRLTLRNFVFWPLQQLTNE